MQREYFRTNREYYRRLSKNHLARPEKLCTRIWLSLNRRTVNGNNPCPVGSNKRYIVQGVRLDISRVELLELIKSEWEAIRMMERPSIDRIDSNGHYSVGNIRFIPFRLNCSLTKTRKLSDNDRAQIHAAFIGGRAASELAKHYGVRPGTIREAIRKVDPYFKFKGR